MIVIEELKAEYMQQVQALQWSLAPFGREREEAQRVLQMMQESKDCLLLVVREGNEVLGTATGICCHVLSGSFLVVEDVVVREEYRGRGIGKQLMEALDEFAVRCGCLYAILVSSGFRKEAHRFYEKQGFTEDVRGFRKGYEEPETTNPET